MELIDLYTRQVGSALPEKMQADIEKEIRSLIEDTLEDESQQAGRPVDDEMVVAVLKRMGPPEKVAASYLPPRYLIGPELYPYFINTLRIVLSVVTIIAAVAVGIGLGAGVEAGDNIGQVIGAIVSGLAGAIINATGIVVLVFAMIQYFSPKLDLRVKEADWDPRKLASEPEPERVGIPGTIAEIVLNVLAVVIFNLYPHLISIWSLVDGAWVDVPLLTGTFFTYLPWLTALWVAEAGLYAWLVATGRWTKAARWASAVISILTAAVLAWMLTGPAIVAVTAESLQQLGFGLSAGPAQQVSDSIQLSVRLVLGMVLALQVLEAGKQLFKLLRGRLPEPLVLTK